MYTSEVLRFHNSNPRAATIEYHPVRDTCRRQSSSANLDTPNKEGEFVNGRYPLIDETQLKDETKDHSNEGAG